MLVHASALVGAFEGTSIVNPFVASLPWPSTFAVLEICFVLKPSGSPSSKSTHRSTGSVRDVQNVFAPASTSVEPSGPPTPESSMLVSAARALSGPASTMSLGPPEKPSSAPSEHAARIPPAAATASQPLT